MRGLGEIGCLTLPACVSKGESVVFLVKKICYCLRSGDGTVRSVTTGYGSALSFPERRSACGVRVFRSPAPDSERLDWSREECARLRIECRSAGGKERVASNLAGEGEAVVVGFLSER